MRLSAHWKRDMREWAKMSLYYLGHIQKASQQIRNPVRQCFNLEFPSFQNWEIKIISATRHLVQQPKPTQGLKPGSLQCWEPQFLNELPVGTREDCAFHFILIHKPNSESKGTAGVRPRCSSKPQASPRRPIQTQDHKCSAFILPHLPCASFDVFLFQSSAGEKHLINVKSPVCCGVWERPQVTPRFYSDYFKHGHRGTDINPNVVISCAIYFKIFYQD